MVGIVVVVVVAADHKGQIQWVEHQIRWNTRSDNPLPDFGNR